MCCFKCINTGVHSDKNYNREVERNHKECSVVKSETCLAD